MTQIAVAAISLRTEDEFTIASLTDDINHTLTYPFNKNQIEKILQQLRKSGLLSINRKDETIKREGALEAYVKSIIEGPNWSATISDWQKVHSILLNKYGSVNSEYEELLQKQ